MYESKVWSIWWNFKNYTNGDKTVVLQTDHPDYDHLEFFQELKNWNNYEEELNEWTETTFIPLVKNIKSGRIDIHDYMKSIGIKKKDIR